MQNAKQSEIDDIPEVQCVVVTSDSFQRDFTGADVPLGSIVNSILTPFSVVEGVSYKKGKVGKCKYESELLAAKVVSLEGGLARKVAKDLGLAEDSKVMEKVLSRGPCLVLCLRGKRGFGKDMRLRIGPESLQGGR